MRGGPVPSKLLKENIISKLSSRPVVRLLPELLLYIPLGLANCLVVLNDNQEEERSLPCRVTHLPTTLTDATAISGAIKSACRRQTPLLC